MPKVKTVATSFRCTDTSASRHFGTGAEVSVGHFGTDNRGSQLVNGGSYVVDGEGGLKQSTFMCRFL